MQLDDPGVHPMSLLISALPNLKGVELDPPGWHRRDCSALLRALAGAPGLEWVKAPGFWIEDLETAQCLGRLTRLRSLSVNDVSQPDQWAALPLTQLTHLAVADELPGDTPFCGMDGLVELSADFPDIYNLWQLALGAPNLATLRIRYSDDRFLVTESELDLLDECIFPCVTRVSVFVGSIKPFL
jgi:hypothetical protein